MIIIITIKILVFDDPRFTVAAGELQKVARVRLETPGVSGSLRKQGNLM